MAFAVLPSPEIWHRDDLPLLCNWRKLWRVVEIGVDRGEYAQMFLARWQGEEYWGVDDYEPYPEMQFPRDADYHMALARLAPHARRAKLIRLPSTEAAALFKPGSVDCVYLDGAHDYASVLTDLWAWRHALSEPGIIAGHDFDDTHPGVKRAVCEFSREINQTVYLTAVEGYNKEDCPSWYLYRSGLPGASWRRC